MSVAPSRRVALFGGGRWAHTLANVLDGLLGPDDTVLWHAQHGADAVRVRLAERVSDGPQPRVVLLTSPEAVWRAQPTAVIVATAPAIHAAIADAAVRRRLPVLVEKPLATSLRDADELIARARNAGVPLGVNLEFGYAAFLNELAARVPPHHVAAVSITWIDPLTEQRYGAVKRADLATHRCLDIYPHIWSIQRRLTGTPDRTVDSVRVGDATSDALLLTAGTGGVAVSAEISRRGAERVRTVRVVSNSGEDLQLDFTREPGRLSIDGRDTPFDCGWERTPRPLTAALGSFLEVVAEPSLAEAWPLEASQCRPHLAGALAAADLAQSAEAEWIAARLRDILPAPTPASSGARERHPERPPFSVSRHPALAARLVDNLAPELARRGFADIARDCARDPAAEQALAAAGIVRLAACGIEADPGLTAALEDSPFLAEVMAADARLHGASR